MFIYPLINGTALSSYLQMSFRVSRDESCAKDLGTAPRVAGCGISIVRMCGAFLFLPIQTTKWFFVETTYKSLWWKTREILLAKRLNKMKKNEKIWKNGCRPLAKCSLHKYIWTENGLWFKSELHANRSELWLFRTILSTTHVYRII